MSDYLDQFFYDEYYRTHSEKSDSELREIIIANGRKTLALPLQPSPQMLAEAKTWNQESKACSALLEERKAQRDALDAALEVWKSNKDSKTKGLILNLPAAVSFTGQLIAAILEEEKLTADELAGWCDELAVLERSELDNLLEELVAEQILSVKDGRYECINICTPSLYPEKPIEWGLEQVKNAVSGANYAPDRILERAELVLTVLSLEDNPLSIAALKKEFRHYSFLVTQGICSEIDLNIETSDLEEVLNFMARCKVLDRIHLADTYLYYIKQLGKVLRKSVNIDEAINSISENQNGENLTQIQKQNLEYKKIILTVLAESGEPMTIPEIMEADPRLYEVSNQRVSALTRQLKDDCLVTRIEEKRKAYFVYGNQE